MIRFVTYFLNNKNWEGRRVQAKKKMVIPWIKLKTTTKIARKRKDDEGKGVETNLRTCHLLVSRGWGIKDDSGLHSDSVSVLQDAPSSTAAAPPFANVCLSIAGIRLREECWEAGGRQR